MWPWFGLTFVHFWQPILDPLERPWRNLHIRSHILGGMVWGALIRLVGLEWPRHVAFAESPWWLRVVAVGLWQLTVWEAIQRENWRPELMGLPKGANHGYPWLSGLWDTIFTMGGALLLEGAVGLFHFFW